MPLETARIRRGLGLCTLALLALAAAARGEEPASPAPSTKERVNTPEHREFERALAKWREQAQVLRRAIDLPEDQADPAKRGREIERAQQASNVALDELFTAATAAVKAENGDKGAVEFVEFMLPRMAEVDRLEEAVPAAQTLIQAGRGTSLLYTILIQSAVDLGDVATAKQALTEAIEKKLIPESERAKLAELDKLAAMLDEEARRREADAVADDRPRVRIETTQGTFVVELFEDDAPNTVANFVYLVEEQFYNGLVFFRVNSGFGAMTGCPLGDGLHSSGYEIAQEPSPRPHLRGTLSMAPTEQAAHGSYVFIDFRITASERLNGKAAVFGRVIEGMDVVCRLQRTDPQAPQQGLPRDRILRAEVLRKRDHKYYPKSTATEALTLASDAMQQAAQGNVDEAIEMLQRSVQMAPRLFEPNFSLAMLFIGLRRGREAVQYLEKAAEIRPTHPDVQFHLGVQLTNLRRIDDAIVCFQAAMQHNPNDVRAYNNLATLLAGRKRFDQAIELLQQALVINPSYTPAIDNLTRVRELKERAEETAKKKPEKNS